ncbi:MAG: peptidyl-prolyl cis-trans isomerase [Candidatus Eisenbacteria bacterium]|nr:peptidyl-prolyl cis-trans isomerase [Candidatus Eisenbacteria bacterium]
MKLRLLAPLGLLLLGSVALAAGPAPQPWKPSKPLPAPPPTQAPLLYQGRPATYVDGVPDTGQFLPDSAFLGRVNDRRFTVRQFREAWFSSYAEYRPRPDSAGRVEFLNSMVNKEVLAHTALAADRPLDFEDRATLREHTQRVLSNVAFQRLVADSAQPSEQEIQHAYAQRRFQLRLQHLVSHDRALIERLRADLAAGRITWSEAVKKHSIAKQDRGPDGELGWMVRNAFDPQVALGIYDLAPGQYSQVFEDREGYQLVRVADRRPASAPPLETVRSSIVSDLAPAAIAKRVEAMRSMLRARIGMTYDSTNIAWASRLFGETAPMRTDEEGKQVIDISGAMPEFAPADTARMLARWNGGSFTLGLFLDTYRAIPVPQRMNVNSFDAFRSALDGFVLEPWTAKLALERRLDRDPLAVGLIERKREELLVEHLFQDSVQSKIWISAAERHQYYESRLREFFSWRKVRFAAIVRSTRAAADSLAERLRQGEDAAAVLRADSLAGMRSGAIQERREDEHGAYQKALFEEMKPGQVSIVGPDRQGDYMALQLLTYDPGHQLPYEEVESLVDESLQNIQAEKLLKELLARHRKDCAIEVHPELVMRIRLVDPVLD